MPKKSIIKSVLQGIFALFPDKALCLFGSCQETCGKMAMEDDLANIKSTKLNMHLSICKKCWNYNQQMKLINDEITRELKNEVESKFYSGSDKQISTAQKESIEKLAAQFSAKPE